MQHNFLFHFISSSEKAILLFLILEDVPILACENDCQIIDLSSPTKTCQKIASPPIDTKFASGNVIDERIVLCGEKKRGTRTNACYFHDTEDNSWKLIVDIGKVSNDI